MPHLRSSCSGRSFSLPRSKRPPQARPSASWRACTSLRRFAAWLRLVDAIEMNVEKVNVHPSSAFQVRDMNLESPHFRQVSHGLFSCVTSRCEAERRRSMRSLKLFSTTQTQNAALVKPLDPRRAIDTPSCTCWRCSIRRYMRVSRVCPIENLELWLCFHPLFHSTGLSDADFGRTARATLISIQIPGL